MARSSLDSRREPAADAAGRFSAPAAHFWPPAHLVLGITLAAAGFVLMQAPLLLWPRMLAMLVLAWWLPGILLIGLWRLPDLEGLTALLLGLAVGWGWMVGLGLLLHWLPGPVTLLRLTIVYGIGALALWVASVLRPPLPLRPTPRALWMEAGILLVMLALLWLPTLGAREFFHDESTVLIRARDALRGVADAPTRHTKGPGEIIVAMVFYRALGTIDEFYARLPFALAGIGAVLLMLPLGRRLFSLQVGLWAAILMGINGYVLALARMTQYQGPLLLLIGGAALAFWWIAETREARALPWLLLGIALTAAGLIMHYEFLLMAPMLLTMLLLGRAWTWLHGRQARMAVLFTLVNGLLVGWVYVRMLTNEYFTESTRFYYAARFQPAPGHNIGHFINLSTLYNTTYFAAGMLLLAALGLAMAWRRWRIQAFLLLLWILPSLLLYLFVIANPGTHYYAMMGGWSLLAALPLARLFDGASADHYLLRLGGAAAFVIWIVISVAYLNRAIMQTNPLYLLEFTTEQRAQYVVPYDTRFATKPRVGLPIKEGWKTLGVLREWGVMEGAYSSNERRTRWYLGDFDRVEVDESPDYFFIAQHVQDPDRTFDTALLDDYTPVGEVRSGGEPRIVIYRRMPADGVFAVYESADFARAFRDHVATLGDEPVAAPLVQDIALSPALRLVSSGSERTTVRRGDVVTLQNRWRIHAPIDRNYKLFVHVGEDDDGAPLAQWDGFPQLHGGRTASWLPGDQILEWVPVRLPVDMQRGRHPIYLGFYDAVTGERYGIGRVQVGEILVR
jgi:4-amino-4-deoxy-L-arabinose transferase-like glycosyltransferase